MKESYGEGVANHTGLRSYAGIREGAGGTLIEVRTGRVLSREMNSNGTPTTLVRYRQISRKAIRTSAPWRAEERSREVRDPWHVRKHSAWGLGDPLVAYEVGRIGKSKDARR